MTAIHWFAILTMLVLGGMLAYLWYRRHTRPPALPAPLAELEHLLKSGRRAEALRLYRAHTGASPTEARDALQALDMGLPGEALAAQFASPQAALEHELRHLLRTGRKISAIRRYQEHTGAGLREARQAVDALEPAPATLQPPQPDAARDRAATLEHELRPLLRTGRKISAIRLYQERTGTGLREARQAIEQLERDVRR